MVELRWERNLAPMLGREMPATRRKPVRTPEEPELSNRLRRWILSKRIAKCVILLMQSYQNSIEALSHQDRDSE